MRAPLRGPEGPGALHHSGTRLRASSAGDMEPGDDPALTQILLTALLVAGLAFVHLVSGKLRFLNVLPRSRWLSIAGGISVAYVFVHLLPDLARQQRTVRAAVGESLAFLESHVYLVALAGLSVFYGLERVARISRRRSESSGKGDATEPGVFWLHIGSFTLYNVLIGYLLLHREEPGLGNLLLYAFAMAVHFLVNDYGLRRLHRGMYDHAGRWILAAAAVAGWGLGLFYEVSEAALAVLFAFLAGGVIMNVLKEELPEERESRFWAFAAGAAGYTLILLSAS